MAMADGLLYAQSVVLGLIVSFLLAKIFSIVFSSGDENLSLIVTKANEHQLDGTRRKSSEKDTKSDAKFSRKYIGCGEKEPLIDHQKKITATSSDSDDDWEGVETTELDEAFCAATAFLAAIEADRSSKKASSNLQLKLYGLYKIATEGACSVPQPSAIKISARARWNAWHKLGAMSQEEAMQQYLEIITELYPSWADGSTYKRRFGNNNETSSKDTRPMGPDYSFFMHEEDSENEFKLDAIHEFSREGGADNLLKDIAGDVSVDTKDSEGQTPLHWAVDHDQDLNLKDNEGQTPLHHTAVGERDEMGVLLVKKNVAAGIQDDDDGMYPSDLSLIHV